MSTISEWATSIVSSSHFDYKSEYMEMSNWLQNWLLEWASYIGELVAIILMFPFIIITSVFSVYFIENLLNGLPIFVQNIALLFVIIFCGIIGALIVRFLVFRLCKIIFIDPILINIRDFFDVIESLHTLLHIEYFDESINAILDKSDTALRLYNILQAIRNTSRFMKISQKHKLFSTLNSSMIWIYQALIKMQNNLNNAIEKQKKLLWKTIDSLSQSTPWEMQQIMEPQILRLSLQIQQFEHIQKNLVS